MNAFEVRLSPSAARAFERLSPDLRLRVRGALVRLATDAAKRGRVAGKSVKSIKGISDSFRRLRVGVHRVMYDVIETDGVVLVLGIVHRGDLERWLRSR